MKAVFSAETLAIPEGVSAKIRSRIVTVTGPRGTLTKDLSHIAVSLLTRSRFVCEDVC
jgi:large subunit ribosomal protein L9e